MKTPTHTASLGSQFDKPAPQEIRQIGPRTFAVFENGNERARFATRAQAEAWQALRQPTAATPAPAAHTPTPSEIMPTKIQLSGIQLRKRTKEKAVIITDPHGDQLLFEAEKNTGLPVHNRLFRLRGHNIWFTGEELDSLAAKWQAYRKEHP